MAAVRYEDVLSVARGLFLAAYHFDQPTGGEGLPRSTISGFVLKIGQVTMDLVPLSKLWVRPSPSRAVAPIYSALYSNDFFKLERNMLQIEQLHDVFTAMWGSAPPAYRIVINTKELHVIARAARLDQLHALWSAIDGTLVVALRQDGVRPCADWRRKASDMLVTLFSNYLGAYLPELPLSNASSKNAALPQHVGSAARLSTGPGMAPPVQDAGARIVLLDEHARRDAACLLTLLLVSGVAREGLAACNASNADGEWLRGCCDSIEGHVALGAGSASINATLVAWARVHAPHVVALFAADSEAAAQWRVPAASTARCPCCPAGGARGGTTRAAAVPRMQHLPSVVTWFQPARPPLPALSSHAAAPCVSEGLQTAGACSCGCKAQGEEEVETRAGGEDAEKRAGGEEAGDDSAHHVMSYKRELVQQVGWAMRGVWQQQLPADSDSDSELEPSNRRRSHACNGSAHEGDGGREVWRAASARERLLALPADARRQLLTLLVLAVCSGGRLVSCPSCIPLSSPSRCLLHTAVLPHLA